MVYLVLILYFGFTFWGSLFGNKYENDNPEAYFLANRDLGTISLFFTILATNFSAFYFLGFAGQAYRVGYAVYVIMGLGTGLAGLSFLLLGPKIWKLGKRYGYITPSELVFGITKSRFLAVMVTLVMVCFTMPYLAIQIIGGGLILESLTQGTISYSLAIVLLTTLTILYVLIGGMQSVARTDVKQGILVILFMVIAVLLLSVQLGGISEANLKVFSLKPELFTPQGANDFYTNKKWFSMLIFWFFCIPMFPQLFMRFYIARDIATLKRSALIYALIPLFISLLPVMIGVWGHLDFPELVGKESDRILLMMLEKHVSPVIVAIVMTGAIAAFMSTLDSQLLACGTMITRDLFQVFSSNRLSHREEVKLGRIVVFCLACLGLLLAFYPFDTIFDMGKLAFSGLSMLFPVFCFVLFTQNYKPLAGILAISAGLSYLCLSYYGILPQSCNLGFESFIVALLISTTFSFLGYRKPLNKKI